MDKKVSQGLAIDIPENLEVALRPEICIYKVSYPIRKRNEAVYTPQVISIGPIHHGKPEFKDIEKQKLIYLKEFCRRLAGRQTEQEVVSDLSCIINECEDEIRDCYSETFTISSNVFVKMIVLDAVFIVELFLRYYQGGSQYENDFILGQPSMKKVVYVDIALLENQLPYFIIEKLFNSTIGKFQDFVPFHELLCFFFELPLRKENLIYLRDKKVKHFTDWARYLLLDVSLLESTPSMSVKLKYNASKLYQAGVKFQVAENASSMLDLKFENGVLRMPLFEIYDDLERIIGNMVAFELCHYPSQTFCYNYFVLIDHLVNTAEDVELLVEAGIIVNWLGSNQVVADLINTLCKGLEENTSCYADICNKLNEHYENRWNRRKATLELVYFSNLWRGTATVAAGLLLIMTLIQTIISIKTLF